MGDWVVARLCRRQLTLVNPLNLREKFTVFPFEQYINGNVVYSSLVRYVVSFEIKVGVYQRFAKM